ncbi:alpha/beta hydrolase family protein [Planosporangium sp. 12N6]|uniref:alpha/beta hydrolase family protein n=1 Tax=Planosporangium spinosum TaxID=3402278 RepID=UPI003CFA379D
MLFAPTRREVTFRHGDSRIVGDLHLPPGATPDTPVPALVMVLGSGPASGAHARNWEDAGARFTAAGLAFYGYDKPGCGESTGDWTRLTFHDRAEETLAAVAAVAAQPGIDGDRIALLGGSQGGWIAPLAATMSDTVTAIVSISGPGVTVAESEEYQIGAEGVREGYTAQEIADALALYRRVIARLRTGDTAREVLVDEIDVLGSRAAELAEITSVKELEFFAGIADYDPVPVLARLRCPILAIFGSDDVLVPTEASVSAYRNAFATSGHRQHRIVVFPGADHRILVPDPGTGHLRRAPGLFELITAWLVRTLRA